MRRPIRLRLTAVLIVTALGIGVLPGQIAACWAAPSHEFIPPVSGPVVRSFEAPLGPYAAGHRGIDYGVPVGTGVVASGSGTVSFAGTVADGLFVTIDHGVIRTSYSFLSRIDVSAGQKVDQGDVIAGSGEGHPGEGRPVMHFGARVGDVYIDPELLLFGNLNDISELIALAPLEEGPAAVSGGEPGGAQSESGLLGQVDLPRLPTVSKGLFVSLGAKIAGAASAARAGVTSVGKAAGAGLGWIGDRAASGWRAAGDIMHSFGSALSGAAVRADRLLGEIGNRAASAWEATRDWVKTAAKSVGGALSGAVDSAKRTALSIGKGFKKAFSWIGKAVDPIRRSIGNVGKSLGANLGKVGRFIAQKVVIAKHLAVFGYGMAKGAIEQIQCSREGGAKPPSIPSASELARGEKAPPPPNDHIVVAVAGIGSSTSRSDDGFEANATIYDMDFRTLGYDRDSVFYFSYEGLGDNKDAGPYSLHDPYEQEDTFRAIAESARLLRDQIAAIHARYPDKQIDIVAHSQGGLVAQAYLTWYYDPRAKANVEIESFVSLASPHKGADAAGIHSSLSDNMHGRMTLAELDWIASRIGLPPPSSSSARQMAKDSRFIAELNRAWDPDKVDSTTIATTLDWVVAAQQTRLRGARHYTADMPGPGSLLLDHGKIVHSGSAKQILYNALRGTPSECTALRNAFADYGGGRLVSTLEGSLISVLDASALVSPMGYVP